MKPVKGKKKIKFFLIFFSIFIVLFGSGASLLIYFFQNNKIEEIILSNFEKKIDKKIQIGKIEYNLKGILINDVKIFDGRTDEDQILARADNLIINLSLFSLLKKKIKLNQIYFNNLHFFIRFDQNNNSNIEKIIDKFSSDKEKSEKSVHLSSIKLENSRIYLINPVGNLAPLKGDYLLNCILKIDENNSLNISKSKIILPENRGTLYPEIIINKVNDDFLITGKAGFEKVSLKWVYQWASTPKPYNIISGEVNNLRVTSKKVEGSVKVTSTIVNSKSIINGEGDFKVDIEKRTVNLLNVNAKIQNSKLLIKNLLSTFDNIIVFFDFKKINFFIQDIKPLYNIFPNKLFGKVTGNIFYSNKKVNADINLINVGYDYNNSLVSGINTNLSIKNNIFTKEKIPLSILENECFLSVASTDGTLKKIYANLIFNKFILPSNYFKTSSNTSFYTPVEVVGKTSIKNFKFKSINISNLGLNYLLNKKNIKVSKFYGNFMDGNIFGRVEIDSENKTPVANTYIGFNGIKVQKIAALSTKFKNRIYGVAKGNSNLKFLLNKNFINTLKGKIIINIDNGKFVNTGVQNGLGVWLSELKYKLRDLEFRKIYGNVDVSGINYYINSFVLNSKDIRLKINGNINNNLISKKMNINLEFTKNFIQDLPTAAVAISLRKNLQGSWYIIPFIVNGDITNSKNIVKIK